VLELMAETLEPELPVVDMGTFMGVVSEELLSSLPSDSVAIATLLPATGLSAFVTEDQHFYDVLRAAADSMTRIVGVVNKDGVYLGSIALAELAASLGNQLFVQAPGGVLVLSIKQHDYSLAEIARLVEGNDAKILTSYVEADENDPLYLRVVVRINQTDLSRVIATLERFGYLVSASFHHAESPTIDQERLDQLLKYLSI
jgi:hypothetical protein